MGMTYILEVLIMNEGGIDRIIRVIVGIGLIALAYAERLWWLYVIGGALLLTGAIGYCGLYSLLGINTKSK
jgi:amino acid permease